MEKKKIGDVVVRSMIFSLAMVFGFWFSSAVAQDTCESVLDQAPVVAPSPMDDVLEVAVEDGDFNWGIFSRDQTGSNFVPVVSAGPIVAVWLDRKLSRACSGVLLPDLRHVLTAAHCIFETKSGPIKLHELSVSVNDIDIIPNRSVPIAVSDSFCHSQYSFAPIYRNDIAVLRLSSDAPKPSELWVLNGQGSNVFDLLNIGSPLTSFGYGVTPAGGTAQDGVLRFGNMSLGNCPPGTAPGVFCSKKTTLTHLCLGDSGGPTGVRINGIVYLVGINSYVNNLEARVECGKSGNYSGFTDIAYHIDWINSVLDLQ